MYLKKKNRNAFDILKNIGIFSDTPDESQKYLIKELIKLAHTATKFSNIEKGILGERLSFIYETQLSGSRPDHVSFKDAKLGYDLLSISPKSTPKRVEAKYTSGWSFHITWNEWKTCCRSQQEQIDYEFQIWKKKNDTFYLMTLNFHDVCELLCKNFAKKDWVNHDFSQNSVKADFIFYIKDIDHKFISLPDYQEYFKDE